MKVAGQEVSKSQAHLLTGLIVLIWGLADLFVEKTGNNSGKWTWLIGEIQAHIGVFGFAVLKILVAVVFIFLGYRNRNGEKI